MELIVWFFLPCFAVGGLIYIGVHCRHICEQCEISRWVRILATAAFLEIVAFALHIVLGMVGMVVIGLLDVFWRGWDAAGGDVGALLIWALFVGSGFLAHRITWRSRLKRDLRMPLKTT